MSSLFLPVPVLAGLVPGEIAIVVNARSPESVHLGGVYADLRSVPPSHIITTVVEIKEMISRNDYDELIARPVRRAVNGLYEKGEKIRCLVTTYGVPLKIAAVKPLIMPEEEIKKHEADLRKKKGELDELQSKKKEHGFSDRDAVRMIRTLEDQIMNLNIVLGNLRGADTSAAVDSELALVLVGDYAIKGMLPNPQMVNNRKSAPAGMGRVLMVSRLDAPTPELAEGLVRTAVEVEETGLSGNVYLDARGLRGKGPYALYDQDIRNTAQILSSGPMPVILDDLPGLFRPGEAPQAALYCGWYRHMKYVNAFTWVKGAVGYHIASSEAVSLHNQKARYWVKSMIERGVIASLGPVAEPYLYAFPLPSQFFPLLMSGNFTLAEVFAMTNPFLSWRMILVGDPLYNPFKHYPAYHADNLPEPP